MSDSIVTSEGRVFEIARIALETEKLRAEERRFDAQRAVIVTEQRGKTLEGLMPMLPGLIPLILRFVRGEDPALDDAMRAAEPKLSTLVSQLFASIDGEMLPKLGGLLTPAQLMLAMQIHEIVRGRPSQAGKFTDENGKSWTIDRIHGELTAWSSDYAPIVAEVTGATREEIEQHIATFASSHKPAAATAAPGVDEVFTVRGRMVGRHGRIVVDSVQAHPPTVPAEICDEADMVIERHGDALFIVRNRWGGLYTDVPPPVLEAIQKQFNWPPKPAAKVKSGSRSKKRGGGR